MGRIVLLLIIVFVLWLMFRGFFRAQTRKKKAEVAAKSVSGEDMVACSSCGVNLPRSEARLESGIYFCNDNPRCRHTP